MGRFKWSAALILAAAGAASEPTTGVRTGFFADEGCARGRANSGLYTETNPDCARKCIEKGSPAVFVDTQGKALYLVKDYAGAKDDLGYRVEVTGAVDESAKTITVKSVKRLEFVGAHCDRPVKK
ncbi:MAG TPA: hypothetical protein VGF59_18445 [Bryobacteraceae bacterium]|jgi:hypothetical protein